MEAAEGRPIPRTAAMNDRDIGRVAAEFMSSSSDRRKRARPSTAVPEPPRKKTAPSTINLEAARRSALDLVRESPSFKRLVDIEERLDLAIMRKQQAVKETLKADLQSEPRIFRLYVFNTFRAQPNPQPADPLPPDAPEPPPRPPGDVASWSLRIQGKLLPRGDTSETPAAAEWRPHQPGAPLPGTQGATTSGVPTSTPGSNTPAAGRPGTAPGSGSTGSNAQGAAAAVGAISGNGGADAGGVLGGHIPKCSDVFSRIVVELDKELYPSNNLIEWKRSEREPSCDGFEISRAGSKEFTARIYLYVDHKPTRYRVSDVLARLIGVQSETRSGIFSSMWQYVKKNRLQCVDDRTAVRLDAGLKTLLGPNNTRVEVVKLQQLFAIVKNHMGVPDPLILEYDVKLGGDVVDNQECYDIHVNVTDISSLESARQAGVFGMGLQQSAEYDALTEKHLSALEKIEVHRKRRDFFEGFCANPVQFINHLILSQTRDLKVMSGSTGRNPEEERRSGFYQQQWVHEAVPRYLLRKAIADTAEDTIESGLK